MTSRITGRDSYEFLRALWSESEDSLSTKFHFRIIFRICTKLIFRNFCFFLFLLFFLPQIPFISCSANSSVMSAGHRSRDRGFESHSGHGRLMCVCVFCV
jgi:hypothetical protein